MRTKRCFWGLLALFILGGLILTSTGFAREKSRHTEHTDNLLNALAQELGVDLDSLEVN